MSETAANATQADATTAPTRSGLLAGIRVVDMGWAWAGAVCGQVLADFGAEVIKIETRTRLDPMRQGRPIIGDKPDPEQNPICHNVNRNKLSVTINLKKEGGRPLLEQLIAKSDILVENLSFGVMDRLGLGFERLSAINPRLIMVSMPGVDAPGRETVRSYAPTINALGGLDSLVGYEDGEIQGFQQALADPNVGLHAAFGALAALRARRRSGRGQHVKLSQLRTLLAILGEGMMQYGLTGTGPTPHGNARPNFLVHDIFAAAGDDEWVSVAAKTPAELASLFALIGRPVPEGDTDSAAWREGVRDVIADWVRDRPAGTVQELCQAQGVPAAPCLNTEQRFFNEQFRSREAYVPVDHPVLGSEFIFGVPWKLSETPASVERRAPLLGEHNQYVLEELLQLPVDEIETLTSEGVFE